MLQFESIGALDTQPTVRLASRPPLPLYVEPAAEEALLSWLLRLATRLSVSLRALMTAAFGVDDRTLGTQWWHRPPGWLLVRISEQTGVSIARLSKMTFEDFQPVYREDEASGRFTGRRYDSVAARSRGYRFVVCGQCLQSDATAYLRRVWLIGWLAVCPDHGTILIERCSVCHSRLASHRLPRAHCFRRRHALGAQHTCCTQWMSQRTRLCVGFRRCSFAASLAKRFSLMEWANLRGRRSSRWPMC